MVSSCALLAQQQGETLLGTAPATHTFVFLECPHPWAEKIGQSRGLPQALAAQMERWTAQFPGTRFFLFTGEHPSSVRVSRRRIFIFEAPVGALQHYQAMQLAVPAPEYLGLALEHWFETRSRGNWPETAQPLAGRHIFVCTHGRRDRCCGRYGQPFYRQARALVSALGLESTVNVWQVSHIGGHRFAPTLVDLPEGRYYGAMTIADWQAVLLRQGSLNVLSRIYRGWSLLPEPVQVLEGHLWQQQGWHWLNQPVRYSTQPLSLWDGVSEASSDRIPGWQIDFTWGQTRWQATLDRDPARSRQVLGSCGDRTPLAVHKYQVTQLQLLSRPTTIKALMSY